MQVTTTFSGILLFLFAAFVAGFLASPVFASPYGEGTYGGGVYNVGQTTSPSPSPSPPPSPSPSPIPSPTPAHDSVATPTCTAQPPGAKVPWLYAAVPQSSSEIDLYFTDADEPYDHYVLAFGTEPGQYTFGSTNIGGKGTRVYRVSHLRANTTYYFTVRAGNGCATGGWSNELSATTQPIWAMRQLTLTTGQLAPDRTATPDESPPSPTPSDATRPLPELRETRNIRGEYYTVRVVVTDAQGKPIEGAQVILQPANRTRVADESGSAIFAGVEPGHYRVLIAHGGYQGEQSIAVEGDERVIELQIQIEKQDILSSPLALWGVGLMGALLLGGTGLWWVRR